MPVRVVLDHPHLYLGRRLSQQVRTIVGRILVALGTAAWVVAVPTTLILAGWLFDDDFAFALQPGQDLSDEVLLAWGIAVACIFLGVRGRGRRMIRRERRLVLFLRRFGYTDATRAVTFAITRTLGRTWRLLTLDDAEVAPIGVSGVTTLGLRLADAVSRVAHAAPFVLGRAYVAMLYAIPALVVLELLRLRILDRDVADPRNFEPYFAILKVATSGRLPLDEVRLDLPGVFALILIPIVFFFANVVPRAAAVPWWGWIALVALVPLLSWALRSSSLALAVVERTRVVLIRSQSEIAGAADELSAASLTLVGARLAVLRVATPVWRQAVSRFATASSVALIDVSDPTEHLVWEIEELLVRKRTRCIFIGHYDRVGPLAEGGAGPGDQWDQRLAALLEWEEILAYTTDARGLKRFARALRNTLRSEGAARVAVGSGSRST